MPLFLALQLLRMSSVSPNGIENMEDFGDGRAWRVRSVDWTEWWGFFQHCGRGGDCHVLRGKLMVCNDEG